MHSWPKRVGTKAKQQFHDGGIGLGTKVVQVGIHLFRCPRTKAEVLVVEEDATKLDRRRTEDASAGRYVELHPGGWRNICPPNPG